MDGVGARSGQLATLPPQVVSRLRSNTIITSLAQAVEELVCNAIDAGASLVQVGLNRQNMDVTVTDNGRGIPRQCISSVAERYCTSKLSSLEQLQAGELPTLGFRGEALASLADCAVLIVSSREAGSFETAQKVVVKGKVATCRLSTEQLPTCGTSVKVVDFLCNQPVRRRRLLARSRAESEQIKGRLTQLWLAHHQQCTITLTELSRHLKLLFLPKSNGPHACMARVFGAYARHAQIIHGSDAVAGLHVDGAISCPNHPPDARPEQCVFVNRRAVNAKEVLKAANRAWLQVHTAALGLAGRGGRGAAVGSHPRVPSFVLFVTAPLSSYDITAEADKTLINFVHLEAVLTLVRHAVLQALAKWAPDVLLSEAGLSPDAVPSPQDAEPGGGPASRFEEWTLDELLSSELSPPRELRFTAHQLPLQKDEVKSGSTSVLPILFPAQPRPQPHPQERESKRIRVADTSVSPPKHDREGVTGGGTGRDQGRVCVGSVEEGVACEKRVGMEGAAGCVPISGPLPLQTRTLSKGRRHSAPPLVRELRRAVHTNPTASVSTSKQSADGRRSAQMRLTGLEGWQQKKRRGEVGKVVGRDSSARPLSRAQEQRGIAGSSTVPLPPSKQRRRELRSVWLSTWAAAGGMPPRQPQVLAAGEGRLVGTVPGAVTRRLLSRCTAIGQCDAQFIPAVCSNGDTKMLVIVDQHAADERVLLEELQAKLAVSDSDVLSSAEVHPPIRVSLGSTEAQALDMHASKAERWGWRFGEGRSGPSCGEGVVETEVLVTCVPCVMGVQLTATDLQLYLLALHETAGAAGAPAAVQRVLVSKACRGAIMFGDKLHHQECQQLLERLAETAMCFDCAHGRPTMAPLFDLRAMEAGACGAVSAESRAVSGGGSGDRAAKVTGERRLTLADLKQRLTAVRGANLLEPAGTG